jgi:hypothetical protein
MNAGYERLIEKMRSDPTILARRNAAIAASWKNPDIRAKRIAPTEKRTAHLNRIHSDPVVRAKVRAHFGRLHADPRFPEWARKGGLQTVISGRMPLLCSMGGKVSGKRNVESGMLARLQLDPRMKEWRAESNRSRVANGAMARMIASSLHSRGRNRPERQLDAELARLGVTFEPDAPIGGAMGIPDVKCGRVLGEFDGGGHVRPRAGEPMEVAAARVKEKDNRHDSLRRAAGFIVIRDSDPIRLAHRIAEAVKGASA